MDRTTRKADSTRVLCVEIRLAICTDWKVLHFSHSMGEQSYVAPGATVANGLTIGSRSLIGMGAVVTKNVSEGIVVTGVPAKPIRNNDHDLV